MDRTVKSLSSSHPQPSIMHWGGRHAGIKRSLPNRPQMFLSAGTAREINLLFIVQ